VTTGSYKFVHLTCTLMPDYLEKCENVIFRRYSTVKLIKQLILLKHFRNIVLMQ